MTKPIVTHESAAERFFAKVDKTAPYGCWLWTAALFTNGYGAFRFNHKQVKAHRFSYELVHGPLGDGLRACHRCDEFYLREDLTYKRCVNPAHLFAGTDAENAQDSCIKGRRATGNRNGSRTKPENLRRGPAHHNAKLDADAVRQIRFLLRQGHRTKISIARQFGISDAALFALIRGETWAHVH